MTNGTDFAFPNDFNSADGLTKREYFAALAMQGMLAKEAGIERYVDAETICQASLTVADELIKQLNNEKI